MKNKQSEFGVIASGTGQVFMDPDKARDFFRKKIKEDVGQVDIHEKGGSGPYSRRRLYRHRRFRCQPDPLEVVHEIVRQRARKRCYRRSGNGSPVCSAQIDAYGNLNSTVIGDYNAPKVRLPGRGGANDFASFCWRTMAITPQDKRRFVEKVDFITTPGWLSGGNSRDESGLPLGTVPYRIITNMAIIGFEEKSKRMIVLSLNPGSTKEEVQENCGFEQLWSEDLSETSLPTAEELDILRNRVDPKGYIINR